MKRGLILSFFFIFVNCCYAPVFYPVPGLDSLMGDTHDIVIGYCLMSEVSVFDKPRRISLTKSATSGFDNDFYISLVLKGNSPTGKARVRGTIKPRFGQTYLLFSYRVPDTFPSYVYVSVSSSSNFDFRGYSSHHVVRDDYCIIPLSNKFHIPSLVGKPLAEQLSLILRDRLMQMDELDFNLSNPSPEQSSPPYLQRLTLRSMKNLPPVTDEKFVQ